MLQIRNLTKTYSGGKKALSNVTLDIDGGDIYGFIGHNGAGKTTTIKSVVGIINFEEGEILVDGISVKENPIACKRKIAYIPDNPDIYEYLTGIQYLNFIADIFKVAQKNRKDGITKYADLFELTSSLGDLISSYSHGMKQKLAIISAVLHTPKLLILDEPFVGLDPKASATLKGIMKELCSQGVAIFFSTHVLEVAEKICNKVAVIKQGRIVVNGYTKKIIANQSLESLFLEIEG